MPFQSIGAHRGNGFFGTRVGPLQRQLRKGEYGLFRHSPMFESDFIQISKQGGPIEIQNQEQIVTVGITASSPLLQIPDILLLARPIYLTEDSTLPHDTKFRPARQMKYELSRLFPLCLVKISVHNAERQQLKFKLATGRAFYLQLCPESHKRKELFDAWTRIIQSLWPPSETKFETKEFNRIKNSPPPRSKAPSPKPTTVSVTAWSDLTVIESLVEEKEKPKASEAKPLVNDPDPPSGAEGEAELVSSQSSQACEVTEASEEQLVERSPSSRSPAGEKGRRESSPPSRRRSLKQSRSSRSKSGKRGATRKPSQLLSLVRSCSWGNPRQKSPAVRSRSEEKKRSTK